MLAMPVRRLLIGVACPHEQGLVEMPPDKLERERQASRREAGAFATGIARTDVDSPRRLAGERTARRPATQTALTSLGLRP